MESVKGLTFMVCYHRWSIQKRWIDPSNNFCSIQHCRRCNKWQREDILAATSDTISKLERKVIPESNPHRYPAEPEAKQ